MKNFYWFCLLLVGVSFCGCVADGDKQSIFSKEFASLTESRLVHHLAYNQTEEDRQTSLIHLTTLKRPKIACFGGVCQNPKRQVKLISDVESEFQEIQIEEPQEEIQEEPQVYGEQKTYSAESYGSAGSSFTYSSEKYRSGGWFSRIRARRLSR